MDRTLYIDAIDDVCKILLRADGGKLLVEELLDTLNEDDRISFSEYETLWQAYME